MSSIILTRSDEENRRCTPWFQAHGLTVFSVPMIELQAIPIAADRLDTLCRNTHETAVLLTSSFACRLWLELRQDELRDLNVSSYYVVGERSAALLRDDDPDVPVHTVASSAETLVRQPITDVTRIIYPCSSARRNEAIAGFARHGIEVIELPLYEPVRPDASHDLLRQVLAEATPPIVFCFFSPSAVKNFFSLPFHRPAGTIFSAIGATTAEALNEHGVMEVIVPDVPDAAAMAAAVAEWVNG